MHSSFWWSVHGLEVLLAGTPKSLHNRRRAAAGWSHASNKEDRWEGSLNSLAKDSQDDALRFARHNLLTNVPSWSLQRVFVSNGTLDTLAPLVGWSGEKGFFPAEAFVVGACLHLGEEVNLTVRV